MWVLPNRLRGTILVALSGMLYGCLGYLGMKLLQEHFSIENMLFWRFFTATIWMLLTSLSFTLLNKSTPPKRHQRSTLIKTIIFATLSYSGSSIFYFFACRSVGTGVAMVIFFCYPVFVTLLAWIFSHWKINKYAFTSLIAVVIGLFFLKGYGQTTLDGWGVFLAIMGALFYAIYIYGSERTAKKIDSKLLTLLVCLGNTFVFLILSYYNHSFYLPHSFKAWSYIAAIGVLATALPIQLLLDGLRYISPIKASILSVLEPIVTIIMGLMLLNEALSTMQSLGVMIVLLGALLIQFENASDTIIERS
jgi:drug/metabolite transporter (DMT)-like permease